MVNQLNKFSPHLADHMKPFHDLLSNRIHWRWKASKETAFHNVKAAPLVRHCVHSNVTWVCEHFQDYLVGLCFQIETDHKQLMPLLSTKALDQLPIRVQRFRLQMM